MGKKTTKTEEAPQADEEPTKADLLEEAKELDVEGRSSMSKDELAAAVEDQKDSARRIKYMGAADVKRIEPGETMQDTMPKINRRIEWSIDNFWIVSASDFPEVADEWWDYLVEHDDFEDVTGLDSLPLNRHQEVFLGMKKIKGQTAPAPDEFPTVQGTTGKPPLDFFDSRLARRNG